MHGDRRTEFAILSPHYDDAVFSCGGLLAANPGSALIVNVCTKTSGTFSRANIKISELRGEEDLRAASLLHFETAGLDELDAPLRSTRYASPAKLFLGPLAEDEGFPERIATKLRRLLVARNCTKLYAPLGIGWHVDHTLSHLTARLLGDEFDVRYYEDAPYCLVAHATRYRLLELGASGWEAEPDLSHGGGAVSQWYDMSTDYCGMAPLRNFKPAVARPFARLTVMGYFARLLRVHAAPGDTGCLVQPSKLACEETWERKMDACYCYTSQMEEFFLNRADCVARYQRYAHGLGANRWAERYWKIRELGHSAA